jgi:hypothetical protein
LLLPCLLICCWVFLSDWSGCVVLPDVAICIWTGWLLPLLLMLWCCWGI